MNATEQAAPDWLLEAQRAIAFIRAAVADIRARAGLPVVDDERKGAA